MRGKGVIGVICRAFFGITPAYAGKRAGRCPDGCTPWDHPRVCGEKARTLIVQNEPQGSPPRMRGKDSRVDILCFDVGITPAYAGKRPVAFQWRQCVWDHPRVCGEKKFCRRLSLLHLGSPPRMRGKVISLSSGLYIRRITPAYAGKRLKRSRSTVPPVAIVPLFPSVCNKPVVSDGSPAGRDAPLFLPAENAVPASPAYNLRSL